MSNRTKLSFTDTSFLVMENRRTPQHVASLALFTYPDGLVDRGEYLRFLDECLKRGEEFIMPFGHVVKTGPLGLLGPAHWERDEAIDLDYHVRHSALPKPGRYRELFALVSRLHSTFLDRNRPLWEAHLIEGLQNNQFALYTKVHHSLVDGVRGSQLMKQVYTSDPKERSLFSPFSIEARELYRSTLPPRSAPVIEARAKDLKAISEFLSSQFEHSVNLSKAFMNIASVWAGKNQSLSTPWYRVPRSPINHQVHSARRYVAQSWPMERIRRVGRAYGGTLNDAVMAMCAGALRKYLLSTGQLPRKSLKAMTPVSIRAADDLDSANAISFIAADLATHLADPASRAAAIQRSMNAGKEQLQSMTRKEIELYTSITHSPMLLISLIGMAGAFPAYSTTISNVPGATEQLYWNGARIDGMYPANIVVDGAALNFTLQSNYDRLDFGIIACRRSVPNMQRLIDYLEDSLVELEDAFGIASKPRKRVVTRVAKSMARTPVKPKSQSRSKSAAKAKARGKAAPIAKTKTAVKAKAKAKSPKKAATPGKKATPAVKKKSASAKARSRTKS